MDATTASTRHTCLKLELPGVQSEPIFVKGTWCDTHFHLSITDGLHTWLCNATEGEVRERASQWDQPVIEYVGLAEKHLRFQIPGSSYGFNDAGDGHKWEEVVSQRKLSERMKVEAEMCLAQSEKFNHEKAEFESATYAKFLMILNSKKRKLRELRGQFVNKEISGKLINEEEEEEISDNTKSLDEISADEKSEEPTSCSKDRSSMMGSHGKIILRK